MSEIIHTLLSKQEDSYCEPPRIVLGQFERTGSTFLLDDYEKSKLVHNEPYKQLVPKTWPIARDYAGKLVSVDDFFVSKDINPLGKLWLKNFAISKYSPKEEIVKETNLYFALPQFLSLFPYRNVELLTRNPLGIIGSFRRNNLFHHWNYKEVVHTLDVQRDHMRDGERFKKFIEQGGTWEQQLMWLIGMNAVLLSTALTDEHVSLTKYDDIIKRADDGLSMERDESSIFGTKFRKTYDDFDLRFTDSEISLLRKTGRECLAYIKKEFDARELRFADELYGDYLNTDFIRTQEQKVRYMAGSNRSTEEHEIKPVVSALPEIPEMLSLKAGQNILWSKSLVTNKLMSNTLQGLLEAGFPTESLYLLIRPNMPAQRGGRMMLDEHTNQLVTVEGFEEHPAYWITWLGAAVVALRTGLSLPYLSQWLEVSASVIPNDASVANHSYAHDDVAPTGNLHADNIPTDFFGNLKIWCKDWQDVGQNKALAGISWKHNYFPDYNPISAKSYMTNSRVIGARLVCCKECGPSTYLTPRQIVDIYYQAEKIAQESTVNNREDLNALNGVIGGLFAESRGCEHL